MLIRSFPWSNLPRRSFSWKAFTAKSSQASSSKFSVSSTVLNSRFRSDSQSTLTDRELRENFLPRRPRSGASFFRPKFQFQLRKSPFRQVYAEQWNLKIIENWQKCIKSTLVLNSGGWNKNLQKFAEWRFHILLNNVQLAQVIESEIGRSGQRLIFFWKCWKFWPKVTWMIQVWASLVASSEPDSGCDINSSSIAVAACSKRSKLKVASKIRSGLNAKITDEERVDRSVGGGELQWR